MSPSYNNRRLSRRHGPLCPRKLELAAPARSQRERASGILLVDSGSWRRSRLPAAVRRGPAQVCGAEPVRPQPRMFVPLNRVQRVGGHVLACDEPTAHARPSREVRLLVFSPPITDSLRCPGCRSSVRRARRWCVPGRPGWDRGNWPNKRLRNSRNGRSPMKQMPVESFLLALGSPICRAIRRNIGLGPIRPLGTGSGSIATDSAGAGNSFDP